MGIYNRDYIREGRAHGAFPQSGDLWAIKFLLIANIAVFVLQMVTMQDTVFGRTSFLEYWLQLSPEKLVYSGQVWRLLTYGFCHSTGSLLHIAFNMYILWMFGRVLEPIYGSREFLAFYLVGIVVSGLAHMLLVFIMQGSFEGALPVIGASGGVMAVVFLTAMHFPRMTIYLMFVIPIELRWVAVLYAVADLSGVFHETAQVAHAAHLGGAAFGVLYRYYRWNITGLWGRLSLSRPRMFRSRPKVRIYQPTHEPPQENLDEQVDAILEKIHEQGEESLTDREREILKAASNRYKNR